MWNLGKGLVFFWWMLVTFFLPILLLKANLVVVAQVQAGSLSISQRIMGKKVPFLNLATQTAPKFSSFPPTLNWWFAGIELISFKLYSLKTANCCMICAAWTAFRKEQNTTTILDSPGSSPCFFFHWVTWQQVALDNAFTWFQHRHILFVASGFYVTKVMESPYNSLGFTHPGDPLLHLN